MTKHEQILQYIEELAIGSKISVRQIAKDLSVSDGTAYRAIKDAELKGYVSTIERVGTVRIEKKTRETIDNLTFAEIVNIIDGQVLAGRTGLHKSLSKFAIGAMEVEEIVKYIDKNTLLIVGNRKEVQRIALENETSVLVTGGFSIDEDIRQLADKCELPIISSNYDSFTVANMINRAIYDQMIKQEVLTVEDILIPFQNINFLREDDTVRDWLILSEESTHTRFPVLDENNKVVGIITNKDIINQPKSIKIKKMMTKNPLTANKNTTVASCAHLMIWEGIELLPVVSKSQNLLGIITRQDVLKAMQSADRQPQIGHTLNDQVLKQMKFLKSEIIVTITPQMANHFGTASKSVFIAIIEEAVKFMMKKKHKREVLIEAINVYFLKTVPIDSILNVTMTDLDIGRNFAKLKVSVIEKRQTVAEAMLICQIIDG